MRKSGGFIYFLGSVGLILVAIVLTSILERSKVTTSREDTRVWAVSQSTLKMTGKIVSVNPNTKVVTVDSLKFTDKKAKDMGTWTVTVDPKINITKLTAGKTVNIGVEASTFNIENHSLHALSLM